jgi:hypothetical protein
LCIVSTRRDQHECSRAAPFKPSAFDAPNVGVLVGQMWANFYLTVKAARKDKAFRHVASGIKTR